MPRSFAIFAICVAFSATPAINCPVGLPRTLDVASVPEIPMSNSPSPINKVRSSSSVYPYSSRVPSGIRPNLSNHSNDCSGMIDPIEAPNPPRPIIPPVLINAPKGFAGTGSFAPKSAPTIAPTVVETILGISTPKPLASISAPKRRSLPRANNPGVSRLLVARVSGFRDLSG